MIIPAIFGATGIVTKKLKQNSEAIPGKQNSRNEMKATLGTSQILWKCCKLKLEA